MESADLLERCYPGRRAESERQILRCALRLFNEQGIDATTIDIIRAESETSVGLIYQHFGNKEDVIAAIYVSSWPSPGTTFDRSGVYGAHADG